MKSEFIENGINSSFEKLDTASNDGINKDNDSFYTNSTNSTNKESKGSFTSIRDYAKSFTTEIKQSATSNKIKSACTSIFSCFSSVINIIHKDNSILTLNEEQALNKLEKLCLETFSTNNKQHEQLLETLIDKRRKIIYEDLGFTSNDPRNDFNIGGLYSLKFMSHFLSFYPHEFMDMKLNKLSFSFANTCTRFTFLIKKFLGFNYTETGSGELLITKKELKKFCILLEDNENVSLFKYLNFIIRSYLIFCPKA